jgi:transposase
MREVIAARTVKLHDLKSKFGLERSEDDSFFPELLNAIYYRTDNGVKWRNLPSDFPAWQTVYSYFRTWVRFGVWEEINLVFGKRVRQAVGRAAEPSLTVIDSQSVKLGQKGEPKLESMATKR